MALVIPLRMKNILTHLAKKPLEWTAFGEIEEVKNGRGQYFILKDISFPPQENAGATTDVSGEDYAKFGERMHKEKKDTSTFKLWIHSHNTMNAFWSGTDTTQMETFTSPNSTHRLSLVVSSTSEWKACFNLYKPIRLDFDIPIVVDDIVVDQEELDSYQKDLEGNEIKKVTKAVGSSDKNAWYWDKKTRSYVYPRDFAPQDDELGILETDRSRRINEEQYRADFDSKDRADKAELDVFNLEEDTIANFDEILNRLDSGLNQKKIKKIKNYKKKLEDYNSILFYLSEKDLDSYRYFRDTLGQEPELALISTTNYKEDSTDYGFGY